MANTSWDRGSAWLQAISVASGGVCGLSACGCVAAPSALVHLLSGSGLFVIVICFVVVGLVAFQDSVFAALGMPE
jgi:hypothetical protein